MAEKTEKATPKKLKDARKKGQAAKSQDFPAAVTYIVAITLTLYLAGFLYEKLGGYIVRMLYISTRTDVVVTGPFFIKEMIMLILITSLPIAGIVSIIGIIVGFLVVGPMFSVEVFKPNFKKFNPIENLKQKFKMKTVIELIKSILKIFGAAILIYLAMRHSLPDLISTVALPPAAAAEICHQLLLKVIIWTGIFFILIAVGDLIYQRFNFSKEMKMEKFEVKQEYKDTEGNPEIKGKRRQLAQEIAYDEGTSSIRKAKMLVTNPKDIAIAIGYEPAKYSAPWIVDIGTEHKALLMIREAERYKVPIMRNVPLAHELFEKGEINKFIPEETYEAVGDVLLYVESLKVTETG
jgi:type III secretion protein U